MVTRDDVARRARTSSAVVSYVVNGGPRPVAATTRARVLKAIADLGYQPNALARGLRTASTKVLGVIVPDISNPFFAELAREIEEAAFGEGYTLLLGNAMHDDARQMLYLKAFAEHRAEGLLLINAPDRAHLDLPKASTAFLHRADVPLVLIDRRPGRLRAACLVVDNEDGGYQATRHLIGHGHRRIGCLSGPPDLPPARDRTSGWRRAMTEAGLSAGPRGIVVSGFDRLEAHGVASRLFRRNRPPTALFVHSDEQAIGVLYAAAEAGIRVPDDIAIVSFDGIRESAVTRPALSTVAQPVRDLGRRAVRLVLDQITDRKTKPTSEMLPVRLITRESCGCEA
jgi:LacI family transcriptional regulator